MSEKKIDLSNVKVGQELWSANRGKVVCTTIYVTSEKIKYPIEIHSSEKNEFIEYTVDGKYFTTDEFPTLFHSREEFLEFHAIAPVRMTEKELRNICADNAKLHLTGFGTFSAGYRLAGGQIIEEPKNLPCPKCGCEIVEARDDSYVYHPYNGCVFEDETYNRAKWNDPSKRGKV